MKSNGPNSPQTIRGLLNRRSQRGLLDTRAKQEADIFTAPMVGPFGKGFHTLHTPAGASYVVGDVSGRTFAPNEQVLVANPKGLGDRAVLGGAPAGKKGGASRSRSPRRRGVVTLETNQYAFGSDGVSLMVATLYADGVYVSTRASAADAGGTFTGCILSDTSTLVGDGSALIRGSSSLHVWDVEGAATYNYTVPAGWTNHTAPRYQGGYIYWVEFEDIPAAGVGVGDPTFDYRLRRSATDLTGVTTIATETSANANTYGAPYTTYMGTPNPWAFAIDTDGAILYMGFDITEIVNFEIAEWKGLQSRFALAGGAPSTRDWSASELTDGSEVFGGSEFASATTATAFAIAAQFPAVHSVLFKSDDASSPATDGWGVSDLDASPGVVSLSVGTAGSVVQAYGESGSAGRLYRGTTAGVLLTATIDAFDAGPNYPAAMFYYGE